MTLTEQIGELDAAESRVLDALDNIPAYASLIADDVRFIIDARAKSDQGRDGWVLVPREPTDAMVDAVDEIEEDHLIGNAWSSGDGGYLRDDAPRHIWRAMIDAILSEGTPNAK